MSTLQLRAYDMLKTKFSEQEAKECISYIETKVKEEVQHENRQLVTKDEFIREIADLRADLTRQIYFVGLIQFLAIVGSVIGILTFMLHK